MKNSFYLVAFILAVALAYAASQTAPAGSPQQPSNPGYSQPSAPDTHDMGAAQDQTAPTNAATQGKDADNHSHAAVDDSDIQKQVQQQLAAQNFNAIAVSVEKGVVTLSGAVPSKEDRKRARELAKSVAGVKGVHEKLNVDAAAASALPAGSTAAPGSSPAGAASIGSTESQQNTSGSIAGNASAANGQTTSAATPQTGGVTGQATGTTGASTGVTGQATGTTTTSTGVTGQATGSTTSQPAGVTGTTTGATGQTGTTTTGVTGSTTGATGQTGTTTTGVTGSTTGATGQTGATTGGVTGQATGTTGQSTGVSGSATGATGTSTGVSGSATGATGTSSGTMSGTATTEEGGDLQGRIENALKAEPTLTGSNVMANVTGDTIELSGSVPTGKEKQTADRIASSFAGNRKVVDRITVTGRGNATTPPPDQNQTQPKH